MKENRERGAMPPSAGLLTQDGDRHWCECGSKKFEIRFAFVICAKCKHGVSGLSIPIKPNIWLDEWPRD